CIPLPRYLLQGEFDATKYFVVLQGVGDMTLREYAKRAEPGNLVRLLKEGERQLGELHRVNRVHGDIKPDNLVVIEDSQQVCDFLLAGWGSAVGSWLHTLCPRTAVFH